MISREAYLSGQWIPEHELRVSVNDLGFALGVTVTERLRTFAGEVFRLEAHLERMRHSLVIVGLSADAIVDQLRKAVNEYVDRHRSMMAPGDDWAIVVFVTPGAGHGPTVAVHGFPLPFLGWADEFEQGVAVYTSDHRQVPPNCWPADLKCRSRMHYYLADQQARSCEPGARGILLDQQGFIGEASTANLIVYRVGQGLLTPCFDRVLPGISVVVVEELASSLGVPFRQADITPEEFRSADEVWLSSTSICVLPVVRCDGQPIADGRPGAVYRRFLTAWGDLVGVDIAAQARQFAQR